MSKPPPRTASPAPVADAPPDLSGGGDTIVEAPAEGRSTRPGPQPKVIRETFSNPSMATSPDVKLLNERKYDAARSKVRNLALEQMPAIGVGSKLPGPTPIPVEGEEVEAETPEVEVTEEQKTPELDPKTAAQIAAKDRENRDLKRKLRTIESSGASDTKKLTQLKELAKTNPYGVAEYLGIPFQDYLMAVQKGERVPLKLDEEPAAVETDETQKLRDENQRLRAAESRRTVLDVAQKRVSETRDDAGKLRWGRIARVGGAAIQAVADTVVAETSKMRKLTRDEALTVFDHFLDEKEAEYKRAAASEDAPRKNPPNPRKPTVVPKGSPMEMRHAKDETDPRNRPSSREIAARLRARLIG